ncbi:hypothetical protein UAY_02235 [Enterococcus moraviensis ATCC BAA-383]|uniref:Rhamnogalacturonase A/B/Epimerase-like pectate lyase domain-containing protein n=1 Tax=Enterococcus moraviensis ATCC BAA-383 TaxID=1158609 RepID=R2T1S6_9ENTE|nr:hypothetical protein UAY_02235 [Enterococcus moraviensis ATCC BAA-383]EOT71859.1 hypothetical protein I586_01666 [Enterococcus moraviensis ATCC BAA-383]
MKKALIKLKHLLILSVLVISTIYIPPFLNTHVVSAESVFSDTVNATDTQFFVDQALIPNDPNDQSAKLNAILTQLESSPQPLYIPSGTYLINNSHVLPNHVHIIGDKNGATI